MNKCVAHGCKTGYASEKKEQHEEEEMTEPGEPGENTNDENISTFHFPNKEKYPVLRAKWVRWVNRKDFETATNSNVICEKHFEEKLVSQGKKCRLEMDMNPMPSKYLAESLKAWYPLPGVKLNTLVLSLTPLVSRGYWC